MIVKHALVWLLLISVGSSLSAQRKVSPADTGRIAWGHTDFRNYDRAAMCNRTLDEVARQYSRIYVRDTTLEPIRGSKSLAPHVPNAVIETVKRCIAHLRLDEQSNDQLWAIARIYMIIGEVEKSHATADRAIATGINANEQREMVLEAMQLYLNYTEEYLPYVYGYANRIREEQPVNFVAAFQADLLMANYYYILYKPDSVLKYTNMAIAMLDVMSLGARDSVNAFDPFSLQVSIANINGDLPTQEKLLEQSKKLLSHWRGGYGGEIITGMISGIDLKKTVYNKKTNALDDGMWENSDGIPRPLVGKPSILVVVNHNCAPGCAQQLNAIKRLHNTFGDSIDLVLITSTMGYAPGSGPLIPVEEAKIAAKFFKDFQAMPFALLVDEAPTYKLDDGRIVRELSPVVQMLSSIHGANAIVTDSDGRIQWAGTLRNDWHLRAVTAVIDRALSRIKK